jgi:UDPglucose 6-dehydrogenase
VRAENPGVTIPYPNQQSAMAFPPVQPPSGAPRPRLSFLGTGYLGATYAICFAELGYEVLGFDVDEAKIAKLSGGQVPFHEPGLDELLRSNVASGRLRFTTSYEQVAEFADVHFICVGTPQRGDGMGADLTYVETSVTNLARHLRRRALIVGKSTVPVGTAEWVEQLVAKHTDAALGIEVAWSPEFLQEGFAVEDVLRPNRIVVGVKTEWANGMLYAAHKGVFDLAATEDREVPLVVTDFATAELVKVAANAFLATKISFINAMAEVCEVAGGDVTQLARAIGYDPRIGNRFLQAGVGFGGGCLPKDIRAFTARAEELGRGESVGFLKEVDAINLRRRDRVVELAVAGLGGEPFQKRVAVLGLSFKPHSDDVRDSPALDVAVRLHGLGAEVVATDPQANANARRLHPQLLFAESATDAAQGADVVVLVTEWPEYRNLTPRDLEGVARGRTIIDARNVLDPVVWRAAGWTYVGLGRP